MAQSEPEWALGEIGDRLTQLAQLRDGWYYEGARAVPLGTLAVTARALRLCWDAGVRERPLVAPGLDGSLMVEWTGLAFLVHPEGTVSVFPPETAEAGETEHVAVEALPALARQYLRVPPARREV